MGSYKGKKELNMICPVCNRPLKSEKSIAKGMGPICEKKLQEMENQPPEGQMSLDDLEQGIKVNG
jgi:hypothetical protein